MARQSRVTRPGDEDEFRFWMKRSHRVDFARAKNYYEAVVEEAVRAVAGSDFWRLLLSSLEQEAARYEVETRYRLLLPGVSGVAALVPKPFNSMVNKAFRLNVVHNDKWPEPPDDGWTTPENWLERILDTVRTTVLVRYLDGINRVWRVIDEHCKATLVRVDGGLEARIEGYYALHLTCWPTIQVRGPDWATIARPWPIEIQVATQVQDVIRQLTHVYYEDRRLRPPRDALEWQWDYRSNDFAVNYLGHILHYIEGTIINVRDGRGGGRDEVR